MLEFGTTRVELGVQIISDEVYRLVKRGHSVEDVVRATAILRENGFKVHYHWMPGLPGMTPEQDLELTARIFSDDRFRPDGLKIYPTMVVEGTELERWYQEDKYKPYDNDIMVNLVAEMKSIVPKYVRISRILRDIPGKFIVGGLKNSLRDIVKPMMEEQGQECKCIRCREYGHRVRGGWKIGEAKLTRMDYSASGGTEVFLSFEDENETLFGLLRMRIPSVPAAGSVYVMGGDMALIRELHVFGPEVALSQKNPVAAQHKGFGKSLLKEAEKIAGEEFKKQWIVVLSGVGAREYYRSEFGYSLEDDYMVKQLQSENELNSVL